MVAHHDRVNSHIRDGLSRGVEVVGSLDAPPIVFLHCAAATRKIWLPQLCRLTDTFRVITLDLPGHGALADVPFSLEAARQRVVEVIQASAGGRALIVGLSLGGYVATDVAHHHPEHVAGLVLSGASADCRGVLGHLSRIAGVLLSAASRIRPLNTGLQWLIRTWLRYGLTRGLPKPEARGVQKAITEAGIYPQAAGEAFREVARQDTIAQLRTFPGPVLIINGAYEKISRSGEAKLLAAAQNGRLCIIPEACHAANLEQPDAFSHAVRCFATAIGWQMKAPWR
jgi:pimeloyl-ACP methyl ester carboxylesterase